MDVRLAADHEQASPQGSVSVPLFYIIEITKAGSMGTFIKGLAYMANGVTPTGNVFEVHFSLKILMPFCRSIKQHHKNVHHSTMPMTNCELVVMCQIADTNPAFLEDLKKAAGDKAVIFACEAGGTLQPNVNFKTGKVSRSLKAAWRALNGGAVPADKAYHLEGGVFGWYNAGLPMSGEYDDSAVWKTPNAVPPVKNT